MTLSRRDFLAGTPAALAGFGLMQAPVSSRTIALVGDTPPLESARQLVHLVETHPAVADNYLVDGAVDALEKAMAAWRCSRCAEAGSSMSGSARQRRAGRATAYSNQRAS